MFKLKKHTEYCHILIDKDSDEGDHFTFNPLKSALHATFDKGKTHIPIDEGLGGLTEWNYLDICPDFEKSVNLQLLKTAKEPESNALYQKSLNTLSLDVLKPKTKKYDYHITEDIYQKAVNIINQSSITSTKLFIENYYSTHRKKTCFNIANDNFYSNNSYYTSNSSSFPTPTLPGNVPSAKDKYLSEKSYCEYWRDKIYQEEGDRIKNNINTAGSFENNYLESIRIPVKPLKTQTPVHPLLDMFSMGTSAHREYSPGEMADRCGIMLR